MNRFKTVFFYIFMSSILVFNTIEPMFTELNRRRLELARKKVMETYKWAKEKLFPQSNPTAYPKKTEATTSSAIPVPIASPTISVPNPSSFAQQAMISAIQQEKADSETPVTVALPEENIVYVTGSEGTIQDVIEIPLDIAKKMITLNNMLGDLLEGTQKIFPQIIPLGNYSKDIIKKVVAILTDINNQEEENKKELASVAFNDQKIIDEKEIENKLKLETTISKHINRMPLNQQLLCLRFCHHMDITDILPTFIDKVLHNLSKASFKDMQNVIALDDLKSGDGLSKELFFNPLQEILRLLIIQKYANERKKSLQYPQLRGWVENILCNKDASVIAFDSAIWSAVEIIYYDFYVFDTNLTYSPLVSDAGKTLADISKNGKKIIAISRTHPFKLLLYSRDGNAFKEKTLDDSNDMHYLSARFNNSETKIVTLARNKQGKAIIQWWDITDINNPSQHSIEFAENIIFSGVTDGHGRINFPYIDFIDDKTIVVFAIDDSLKLKLIFHTIDKEVQNSQESLDLFNMSFSTAICDINKKTHVVVIYHQHEFTKNMYIIENNQMKEIIPFKNQVNSIKFSSDGSKVICLELLESNNKKISIGVKDFRWPRNSTGNESLYDIQSKTYVPILDNTVNAIHADCLDNALVYAQNIFFPIKSNNPDIQSDKHYNPIILTVLPPSLSRGIAKHLSFQTNLSGLPGEVTALRFSPDGTKIIAASTGRKGDDVIVWPLVTPEEDEALKNLNKMDISLAKLLLPISIASLKQETTVITNEQQNKINKILSSLPKSIADTLLIKHIKVPTAAHIKAIIKPMSRDERIKLLESE